LKAYKLSKFSAEVEAEKATRHYTLVESATISRHLAGVHVNQMISHTLRVTDQLATVRRRQAVASS